MTIRLPSTLGVVQVAEYRAELLSALEAGGDLELDARGVEEIDVAGLQLLEAAHRSAIGRGLRLSFTEGGRGAIEAVAKVVGLRLSETPTLWREVEHG